MRKRFVTADGHSDAEMSIDGVKIPIIFNYSFFIDASKFLSSGSRSDTGVELRNVSCGGKSVDPNMSFSYFRIQLRKKGQGYTLVDPFYTNFEF